MANQSDIFRGEFILYKDSNGNIELDVRLEQETIWLSQKQMSVLFQKNTDTISFHLGNIYEEGELEMTATTEDYSVVQKEGSRQVRRKVRFYNLDAIISVGYRVNSKRGTQFRIWATGILRDHILRGYSVNQTRLQELNQGVRLIAETASRRDLSGDEARALLQVVGEVDGNKRIGAALFLWFLECNGILVDEFGRPIVSNAALVAMTLMIAESRPEEKEILVRIVTHLLCKNH